MRLQDKAVVITGASSGIGKATARLFAEKGARLVLAARRLDALEETAAECRLLGADAMTVPTDVASEQDVENLARQAVERFGCIDVWVNDAGVYLVAQFEDAPMEVFRRVMETNFFGVVNGSLAAVRQFKQQGEGVLINVSSLDGKIAMPYVTAYVASKHAVRGFDESLRQELIGTGIKVCTILPGAMDTPLFGHSANYTGKGLRPPPPVYDPRKVAKAIVRCAERPQDEKTIGGVPKLLAMWHSLEPSAIFNRASKKYADVGQFTDEHAEATDGNVLHTVNDGSQVTGGWRQPNYSRSKRSIVAPLLIAVPAAFGAWFYLKSRNGKSKGGKVGAMAAGVLSAKAVQSVMSSKQAKSARKTMKAAAKSKPAKAARKQAAKLPDVRHAIESIDRKRVEAGVASVRHALGSNGAKVNGAVNGKHGLRERVRELVRR
jgi:short-subunit dehydrogenase